MAAKVQNVPIRIGVNFGSLPPVGGIGRTRGFSRHMDLVNKLPKAGEANEGDYSVVDHMVATALWEISLLEEQDFDQIKISMKAFDVPTTVEAYAATGRDWCRTRCIWGSPRPEPRRPAPSARRLGWAYCCTRELGTPFGCRSATTRWTRSLPVSRS